MNAVQSKALRPLTRRFLVEEDGPTATEYAILLSLIIIGSIGIIGLLGESFATLYSVITAAMPEGFA